MATSKGSPAATAHPSSPAHMMTPSPHSRRITQRPSHLKDYIVDYRDRPAVSSPSYVVSPCRSHTASVYDPGQSSPPSSLMQQIVETARQQSETAKEQSETARRQTELLEQVLLRNTPQSSALSSRAASRQPSPRAPPLKSVGRVQPSPDERHHALHPRTTEDPTHNPSSQLMSELPRSQPNPQGLQVHPSPPLLSRVSSLRECQYDTLCNTPSRRDTSAGFMQLPPLPLSPEESQAPRRPVTQVKKEDPQADQRCRSQLMNEAQLHTAEPPALTKPNPPPVWDYHSTPYPVIGSTLRPDAPWYVPFHAYHHVEGPTFPDLTKEDRAQYVELRLTLNNLLHEDQSEQYKYSLLLKHVKAPNAHRLVLAHAESSQPYTNALQALDRRYGRPYQFVLKEIEVLEKLPPIRAGDERAFDEFSLRVQAIVGMLKALKNDGKEELYSGSNVKRLLNRLPRHQQQQFRRQHNRKDPNQVKTSLIEFADWLQFESECMEFDPTDKVVPDKKDQKPAHRFQSRTATIMHGAVQAPTKAASDSNSSAAPSTKGRSKGKVFCPYCDNTTHYLSQCTEFASLSKDQAVSWIKANKRCWRCARGHLAKECDLKKPCRTCNGKHLSALHDVNQRSSESNGETPQESAAVYNASSETLYLDQPHCGDRVLLKVVKVILYYQQKAFETHAILDDGSERTILLSPAAQHLGLQGKVEHLKLRTVHQEIKMLRGASVSFNISSVNQPHERFHIQGAFTADHLGLAEYTYPVPALQRKYEHLQGLPIPALHKARPMLLIGSDHPDLLVPVEPVRLGPPGGPAAVKTRLGWTLQGPSKRLQDQLPASQCLFTSVGSTATDLYRQVERLWQLDTLPFRCEREVTRSRQDQEAVDILEMNTTRVEVDGTHRYATPLLRIKNMPKLKAPKEAVMSYLRSTERRLTKDPQLAATYSEEMEKLEKAGYTTKLSPQEVEGSKESWYIPHHMVSHNGKNRVVFNCSFTYKGENLNNFLLPGPTLGSSLLGVLIRFREHHVAISGDIKGMFHQVRLLTDDKPLLRFLWRDLKSESPPEVYEWQVLPFGTACSPCCATFALQRHVLSNTGPGDDVRHAVERCFYVDNCLLSTTSGDKAKQLVDKLRELLALGGFEIRQWASNVTSVVSHLPKGARSESTELEISESQAEPQEHALGLTWHCSSDTLHYRHRPSPYEEVTMRNIYRVLASQYDPLGYILPFTTRAKVLVQRLWAKEREWDDPLLPSDLLQTWKVWEDELQHLPQINLPRCCVTSRNLDNPKVSRDLHIFCDASEVAYGSVAYLRTDGGQGNIQVAFILARSRVAPKRQQSMPRLELCAALTGAQLSKLLHKELTLEIKNTILWTDSTTVLTWLKSESCRFKVFVGTRVAEIQELTEGQTWRYVNTTSNPADDVTRGKTLLELAQPNRWSQGPQFLYKGPETWPVLPTTDTAEDPAELRKPKFCGLSTVLSPAVDFSQYSTFEDLVEATRRSQDGAANQPGNPSATDYQTAETTILQQAQIDSFGDEYKALNAGKSISSSSRLIMLSPEFDTTTGFIRVGGRLRRAEGLSADTMHPIVLDPKHPVTPLLIKQYDSKMCHPGPERVFAEIRRRFWILRGREAVRRHQRLCPECQKWRAKPKVPKMADLPPARLRLLKPAFYSTGVDCFGPFLVKRGRCNEKRWGLIFKCMTTRCVHLDLLPSMDSDSFLMALRRFVARRGTPFEVLSDQGTNFRGGDRELQESFAAMSPTLQAELAKQRIRFNYNPPNSPHFGGAWEREIRSVKAALHASIGAQTLTEEVLRTVLTEVEGILNAKPLGYVSSDVSDPDPVTPNYLLMGRPDSSLPQVVYPESEILSRRRWRHSQVLADQFWSHFIKRYLPTLQPRQKWQSDTEELTPGTVVMIVDHQLPRALWPVGKVKDIHVGADGHIRSANVQVKDRVYHRAVARLIRLPAIPEDEEAAPSPRRVEPL